MQECILLARRGCVLRPATGGIAAGLCRFLRSIDWSGSDALFREPPRADLPSYSLTEHWAIEW